MRTPQPRDVKKKNTSPERRVTYQLKEENTPDWNKAKYSTNRGLQAWCRYYQLRCLYGSIGSEQINQFQTNWSVSWQYELVYLIWYPYNLEVSILSSFHYSTFCTLLYFLIFWTWILLGLIWYEGRVLLNLFWVTISSPAMLEYIITYLKIVGKGLALIALYSKFIWVK